MQKAKATKIASTSKQNSPTRAQDKQELLFDEDYAVMFIDCLVDFIKETEILNHINLSGLQLKYVTGGNKF